MTQQHLVGAPGHTPGRSALRRLVACDPETFAARHWGREPLLSRAGELPGGFDDLFSEAAVDELVSTRGLRTPFLRVAKEGTTLGDRAFTAPGGVGAGIADQVSDDKLAALFADGATLVLQALHRTWPALVDLASELATELAHPVQVNAYVTPPQNRGFDDHYDVHDVFVLQVAGEKRWRIHEPVHPAPLRDQPWTERREAVAEEAARPPWLEATLQPGDCLYLPRGYLHAATALGGVSTHLTVGVHTWTRQHLAEKVVAELLAATADDVDVRGSLGLGVSPDDAPATADDLALVVERLSAALGRIDPASVASRMAAPVRAAGRAEPLGPLTRLAATSGLDDADALRLRQHLVATLDDDGPGRYVLRSRAGDLVLDGGEAARVAELLAAGAGTVADLGPGLAHRLVVAGVVVRDGR
ncbi:cupin domain-containing protein [Solicola sp. PLA-1-18]|uniref:cupin domain-containing protein n=1 Tax=Solicola sp. PLA-1-18 TaxID=3380532 RepID=UPI003B7D821E